MIIIASVTNAALLLLKTSYKLGVPRAHIKMNEEFRMMSFIKCITPELVSRYRKL